MTTETLYLLLPEIILVMLATAIYVGGAFTAAREGWAWLAIAGLLLAALALNQQQQAIRQHQQATAQQPQAAQGEATGEQAAGESAVQAVWSGPIVVDLFAQTTRWFVLGVGLILVMLLSRPAAENLPPEFMGSLLLLLAGLMVIALSNDLVLIFLGLELVSIPTYVVLYLGRADARSQEAATKYFFLSILSSALLLYGFSFLYGVAGSTRLLDVHHELGAKPHDAEGLVTLARLALVLIFAGLGFRLTVVPFHFYAPDVYQGTSHGNAALLAVVPKIAGLVALVRIVLVPMVGEGSYLEVLAQIGWQLSLVLAVLTMTVGNLLALWQQNIRRMLAYSSIAHAGYMLIGLAMAFAVAGGAHAGTAVNGVGATLFYLLVYSLATAGVFAGLAYLSSEHQQLESVDDIAGLGRTHPISGAAMAICLLSLTGLPPMAGFWGKFVLLSGAWSVRGAHAAENAAIPIQDDVLWLWFVGLSVVAMVNAAISAGYYLRLVAAMYFRESLASVVARGGYGAGLAMVFCTLGVLVTGAFPGPPVSAAQRASHAANVSFVHRADAGQALGASDPRSSRFPVLAQSPLSSTPSDRNAAAARPDRGAR